MDRSSLQKTGVDLSIDTEMDSLGRTASRFLSSRHSQFRRHQYSSRSPFEWFLPYHFKRGCNLNIPFYVVQTHVRCRSRPYTIIVLSICVMFFIFYLLYLFLSRDVVGDHSKYGRKRTGLFSGFSSSTSGSKKLTPKLVAEITNTNHEMVYIHNANIVLVTMAQAGTASLFQWLYRGTTGRLSWDRSGCSTSVQDVRSHCWTDYISNVYSLDPDQQLFVLTSPSILRIAVQRDPFERLISAYKSKIACTTTSTATNSATVSSSSFNNKNNVRNKINVYTNSQQLDNNLSQLTTPNMVHLKQSDDNKVNIAYRNQLVPLLRRLAALPPPSMTPNSDAGDPTTCMSISEFANVLDRIRRFQGTPLFIHSISDIDVHLRPQNFYFDRIQYDMVLDIKDLSDSHVLQPIINRLPFGQVVNHSVPVINSSKFRLVDIPIDAAVKIRQFAELSMTAPLKYMSGFGPSSKH